MSSLAPTLSSVFTNIERVLTIVAQLCRSASVSKPVISDLVKPYIKLGSDEDTFELVAFTLVNIYNLMIFFIRPCSMHQEIIQRIYVCNTRMLVKSAWHGLRETPLYALHKVYCNNVQVAQVCCQQKQTLLRHRISCSTLIQAEQLLFAGSPLEATRCRSPVVSSQELKSPLMYTGLQSCWAFR